MSIGATLAAARRRAGLTVSEVSHSTRVTEPIIRGIELDDYAACGGDFYARGHIRAIARAVGEDPLPLIDEFDSTWRSAKEITAAEAFEPGMPLRKRERRRVRWTAFLAVLVLAVLGFASYKFVSGVGRDRPLRRRQPAPVPAGRPVPACRGQQLQPSRPAPGLPRPPRPRRALRPRRVLRLRPAPWRSRRSPRPAWRPSARRAGRRRQSSAGGARGRRERGHALVQPVVRQPAVRGTEDRNGPAARHGPPSHRLLGAAFAGQPLRCRS